MTTPQIEISRQRLTEFCRRYPIQRLSLFGSVLRADFKTNSDVDVLVTFIPGVPVGFLMMGRMKRELAALFQHRVDLVPETGLKPVIRDEILASVEEIYAV
jgi:predicted nucleotidyltransferase